MFDYADFTSIKMSFLVTLEYQAYSVNQAPGSAPVSLKIKGKMFGSHIEDGEASDCFLVVFCGFFFLIS